MKSASFRAYTDVSPPTRREREATGKLRIERNMRPPRGQASARTRIASLTGASRTDVVTAGARVVGYHALATGAVDQARAPGGVRRNMPDPIPVMIIGGRLAVDRAYQGRSASCTPGHASRAIASFT